MSIYEKEYKIQSSDVDMFRRLRISKLFEFMQEAAIHHTEELGAGREKTLDRGFLWVVTMQHAEIKRLPEYDEEIKLISRPGKTMHVMFPRYYSVVDSDENEIVRGSALWMLMDMNNRKMIFPEAEGISIEGSVTGNEYELPKAIKPEETDESYSLKVPYSFTDINGHLTNTKYFDIAEDITLNASENRPPKYVSVEYSGEARFGEKLDIQFRQSENEIYLFGTKDEGKKVFKLKMIY
ncbi:MAG: hypothetical protein J5877_01825 [Clostridia bacterium]|nr:hypothetical protein [Clostridia bacterium]